MDIDPSVAFNLFEETDIVSSNNLYAQNKCEVKSYVDESEEVNVSNDLNYDASVAFTQFQDIDEISGFEPVLGGELREKAIWVDEAACIGCQYCVHVANNTFIVDESLGRSRVVRQDGDTLEIVQEAIDTCPVDCIHWVEFEDLDRLDASLNRDMFQSLGKLPKISRY